MFLNSVYLAVELEKDLRKAAEDASFMQADAKAKYKTTKALGGKANKLASEYR